MLNCQLILACISGPRGGEIQQDVLNGLVLKVDSNLTGPSYDVKQILVIFCEIQLSGSPAKAQGRSCNFMPLPIALAWPCHCPNAEDRTKHGSAGPAGIFFSRLEAIEVDIRPAFGRYDPKSHAASVL